MKTKMLFKNTILVALIVALALAVLPLTGASAAGKYDPPTPPAVRQGPSHERMEKTWQQQLKGYERLGRLSDKSDELFARADKLVAALKAMGTDTTKLEAALADFKQAVQQAKPILESCKGIVVSHKGFDENGKVTDAAQAIQTLGDLGSKLREIRDSLEGKGKVLADLLKPIRDLRRPAPTATPSTDVH
jgi:hypothetical protein